jgi:hypothetical protein
MAEENKTQAAALSSEENASDWLQMKSHSKKEMNTLNENHKISP